MKKENSDELFEKKDLTGNDSEKLFGEGKEKVVFEEKEKIYPSTKPVKTWKVLVVDDEEDIHSVTRMALKGFIYQNKEIEFLDTYSARESRKVIRENPDIAVILLDVVMETNNAGLELVKYIRDKAGNHFTQIILRTGYPGQAPEREVIVSYEINDYKTKTELTSFKLFTVILASLRAYDSVMKLEGLRRGLEEKVRERTSELEKKNIQIMEMDQMKTRFFSNISHEFRTPLTLIIGPVEEMLSAKQMEEKERRKVERMHRNALRLLDLINQLLDLSKLDAGNMKLKLTEEDIVNTIRLIITGFAGYADRKKIQYKFSLPDKPFKTYFDRDKLDKITTNLLSNAFKYTPEKGGINCDVSIKEQIKKPYSFVLELSVKDTGPGIPEEQLEKIFDRFYQVEGEWKKEGGGTGIGLSLTRELVSLQHGKITVKSEPGKGCNFIVTMPLGKEHLKENEYIIKSPGEVSESMRWSAIVEEGKSRAKTKEEETVEGGNPQILIVEDNPDVRMHILENLEEEFLIKEAANGEEGLEKAIESVPDLVITDLMMPKMDGVEMCEKLKTDERTSHIPVIMLTAKANVESKIEGLETGADDYITKPFNIKELITRVKNLIEQRKKLRERFSREVTLEPKDIAITSADEKFLNRAIGIIEEKMGDFEFDAQTLQEGMNLSRSQLFRKLKALTDQSATEFIRVIRLKRGAKLLEQKFGNVAEVTYEVGFNNLSYFAKCFKELLGVSPSEYVKQNSGS
jgi:signal transduction histidine kinase/AraC-like DNA-binding protein